MVAHQKHQQCVQASYKHTCRLPHMYFLGLIIEPTKHSSMQSIAQTTLTPMKNNQVCEC